MDRKENPSEDIPVVLPWRIMYWLADLLFTITQGPVDLSLAHFPKYVLNRSSVLPQDCEAPGCLPPSFASLTWLRFVTLQPTHPTPCHLGKPLRLLSLFQL